MKQTTDSTPLILVLLFGIVIFTTCSPPTPEISPAQTSTGNTPEPAIAQQNPPPDSPPVDFNASIRPIFESRCKPCHFEGGKMYAKLPFDNPQTIRELGTRLFSRIKNENEQALIRAFLAQNSDSVKSASAWTDN